MPHHLLRESPMSLSIDIRMALDIGAVFAFVVAVTVAAAWLFTRFDEE